LRRSTILGNRRSIRLSYGTEDLRQKRGSCEAAYQSNRGIATPGTLSEIREKLAVPG